MKLTLAPTPRPPLPETRTIELTYVDIADMRRLAEEKFLKARRAS